MRLDKPAPMTMMSYSAFIKDLYPGDFVVRHVIFFDAMVYH